MTQILFRQSLAEEDEFEICKNIFGEDVKEYRSDCKDSLVIGRYSCLPYYKELVNDLANNGCELINSHKQHQWIADYKYYDVLKSYMSKTWTDDDIYQASPSTKFIVKGKTNSRKTSWKTLYADSRKEAVILAAELKQDSLIGSQDIIYREYVELENFGYDCTGIPIANEWRFFCFKNKILTYGYYWSNFPEIQPTITSCVFKLAEELVDVVSKHVNFYVLDIAKTKGGQPLLIEINDGQMSGPSNCSLQELYEGLLNETKYIRRTSV